MEKLEIYQIINLVSFIIGLGFGAIAQKNQFCFSGSIKDFILTKSTKRASSVIVAMLSAILSSYFISSYFDLDLTQTHYYKANINYFVIILGGSLFGIGMMIADGCSSRHLIKLSQGDGYSLIVLIFIAISAFAVTKGILNPIFEPLINSKELIFLSSYMENFTINIYFIVTALLIILLILIQGNLKKLLQVYDGLLIGLFVGAMWFVTGVLGEQSIERVIPLSSLSFVYPSAQTLQTITEYNLIDVKHSTILLIGVFCGAFLMSLLNKKYSFGCTSNIKGSKLRSKILGGILMGTGGVLAIGCTVGQGLSGFSTLAFSSFIAISSILIAAYISAIILNKSERLPMCFIFEWEKGK